MQLRTLGRTGLQVSVLTFGCGAVGGLMVKGSPEEQERTAARAIELGVNYFDTAPGYGNGRSEDNLGRILAKLKPDVIIGTKVRLQSPEAATFASIITESIETSLRRLGRDHVDIFQLHNELMPVSEGNVLSAEAVLNDVVPVLEKLRQQGKTRFIGFTALGDTKELHRVIASGAFDTAQICYNMLNPSACEIVPEGFPGQDYALLMERGAAKGVGSIGIRLLAGGALSGSMQRHPHGMAVVAPLGSGRDYATDVARAQKFQPLVDAGFANSLPELAARYVLASDTLSTTQVGIATYEQFETAAQAMLAGPLPAEAMSRIAEIRSGFTGEPR